MSDKKDKIAEPLDLQQKCAHYLAKALTNAILRQVIGDFYGSLYSFVV